jgi:hypothetical protein
MRYAHLSIGNFLELVAAVALVYGVDALAGWRWSLIAGAAVLAVAAEFIYDGTVLHIPISRRRRANDLPDLPGPDVMPDLVEEG